MRQKVTVFCDFDGTVTMTDTTKGLLAALADPSWMVIETDWEQGRIGSRECLAKQIPLIRGGWSAIEGVLKTVSLDPTFAGFASWCDAEGIDLIIVSDGLDRVIQWLLARERIQVKDIWSNRLVAAEHKPLSVAFPHPPIERDCQAGLCKCQILAQAAALRVVIGDGLSDLCWASRADYCFAKGRLLELCRAQRIACRAFKDFSSVQRAVASLIAAPVRPALHSF